MEPESLIPHSQVPATCLYPEPAQSSPYPHVVVCILVEMHGKFLGTRRRRHGIRFLFTILYRFVAVKISVTAGENTVLQPLHLIPSTGMCHIRKIRLATDLISNGGPITLVL
jgi:hypothetical protein